MAALATRASWQVGDQAPEFALPAGDGRTVRLSEFRGRRVVLYFYPKDHTPGCTKEACEFQAALARVQRANAVVLGVSRDEASSHRRFADAHRLRFPLLSDPDAKVCSAYGVYKQKSLYGRSFIGIERTTFLIDEEGRIAAIFPRVRVDGHVQAVLAALGASPARGAPASKPAQPAGARARGRPARR
jgi:peroxiredoxin Q/BCP